MAITRARKEELVAEYRRQLEESSGIVIAEYVGLTVPQMETLRRSVREQEGRVFVVKNTLINMVLTQAGFPPPEGLFTGPTLVAFCHKDVPPLAKVFRDFAKEMEEGRFRIKGGLLEGAYLSTEEVLAIADLPGRDVLMAQVLGTINAPASQVAGVVANGIRQIMNLLQAYIDKLEGGNASAEAAA